MNHRHLTIAVGLALLGVSGAACAITNVENNASIPFSFSSPGARSLGMGGAFIALADDATAAYTNPAGLTGLGIEQQVSIEVRRHDVDAAFASSGSAAFNPVNFSGVNYDRSSESVDGLSFVSWVLPRDRWSFALYRHELVNYESRYATSPIAFDDFIVRPYVADTDLKIVNYGASFGFNVNDQISVGAGLSWYDFDINTAAGRYDPNVGATGDNAALVSTQTQNGNDDDVGFNLGVIFRVTDSFNIGASYRSAPEFTYRATNVAGPAFIAGAFTGQLLADKAASFEAPDSFGLGFHWRATDNLGFTLDLNRINYSNISKSVDTAFFNAPGAPLTITTTIDLCGNADCSVIIPSGTATTVVADQLDIDVARTVQADDAFEPRLGMEYAFANLKHPLYLRAGIWREDQHTLRMNVDPALFGADPNGAARANAILFSSGSDETHYSFGVGWTFSSFQLDFATDQSERIDTYSVSGVWRF